MNSHEWFIEQRSPYATQTQDPTDEPAFVDHLKRCAECRAAVHQLERELGWLPMGVNPVSPRPGFRWQVAEAVLGPRRPVRWVVWMSLAAAAAFGAVAVGVSRRAADREARLTATQRVTEETLAALSDTVAMLRRAARVMQASIQMEGHQGGLLIFADSVTHKWSVVLHGLPPAPPGEKYQFWFVCDDGMVRGAEIVTVAGRPSFVTLGMPAKSGNVLGAALSMEPLTNAGNTPQGKELAHLTL